MKVLVLGGTGAMGVHVVSLISQNASCVVVTSRSRLGTYGIVEYVKGDAKNPAFLDDLLKQKWDVIVDFMVYTTQLFRERYKKFLASTEQYVFISSSRVYASSDKRLTENSPRLLDVSNDKAYLATDEYALSKARQENMLFASPQKNWTVIRPYITYGDNRLQLGVLEKEEWLYRALQGRTILAAKHVQSKYTTMTHGLDVAKSICALLGQQSAHGEAFHITSDNEITWGEILEVYLNVLESHLQYRPLVRLQEHKNFMMWRAGKYPVIYDRMYDRRFDNTKIGRFVSTDAFVRPQVGLTQCLKSFISTEPLQFNTLNWRAEGIKDRLLGEQAAMASIAGLKQKAKYCLSRFSPLT